MRRSVSVPAAMFASAALVLAACNGSDDEPTVEETPEVETTPEEESTDEPEEPAGEAEGQELEPEGEPLETQEGDNGAEPEGGSLEIESAEDGNDGGADDGGADDGAADNGDGDNGDTGRATPQDHTVDAVARHPGGTLFDVSEISFNGAEIRIEAELLNGSEGDIRVNVSGGQRMRLVDDLGNNYNFVVPDEFRDRDIELAQGESISGEWIFIGPVDPNASELTFAANTRQDNPVGSDMDSHRSGASVPVLVLGGISVDW